MFVSRWCWEITQKERACLHRSRYFLSLSIRWLVVSGDLEVSRGECFQSKFYFILGGFPSKAYHRFTRWLPNKFCCHPCTQFLCTQPVHLNTLLHPLLVHSHIPSSVIWNTIDWKFFATSPHTRHFVCCTVLFLSSIMLYIKKGTLSWMQPDSILDISLYQRDKMIKHWE